jgi:ABC-type hemin transport system, periplasmic component
MAQTRAGDERKVLVVDDRVLLSFGARTPALIDRLTEVLAEGPA